MWFNKKSGSMPEDKGWEAMRQLLDRELPEKKRKNRLILWFWPLLFGLGLGFYYTYMEGSNVQSPAVPKSTGAKPEAIVNFQTKKEASMAVDQETHVDAQTTASSSTNTEVGAKTGSVAGTGKKNTPTIIKRNTQTNNTNNPPAITLSAIDETNLIASSLISTKQVDDQNNVETEAAVIIKEENRNSWITTSLSEKSIQALSDNSDYQMPVVATISHKASWASAFIPYISVAGLMSHDTKDKGYSFGAGLHWKPLTRLSLSAGVHYENYRGTYAYPAESIILDSKSHEFNALTNVRQWSVPVLVHFDVIGNSLRLQGGLVSNYIRKTNEYYALPGLADVQVSPGSVENSLTFASEAANGIPQHYFEWQTGLSYRFWKSFSGTVYYRRQFEKENPGIVPSTGVYGMQLTYYLK